MQGTQAELPEQLSVDMAHHVITDIRAYHADGKDNQQLQDIAYNGYKDAYGNKALFLKTV